MSLYSGGLFPVTKKLNLSLGKYASTQAVRKKFYTRDSISHPAKADISMMRFILENYVEDGDTCLDCMAGIATTLIEGMFMYPNSTFIGIEYEKKFTTMAQANIRKVERYRDQIPLGKAYILQGDARALPFKSVDKCVFSPTYGDTVQCGSREGPGATSKHRKNGKPSSQAFYSSDPTNLGNLKKYGEVDKVVTSPPWGGKVQHETNYLGKQKRESGFEYSGNPQNLGNLPHGQISKVITNPPYEGSLNLTNEEKQIKERSKRMKKAGYNPKEVIHTHSCALWGGYSKDSDNIGNTKGQTYLNQMLLVYQECYRVLKPQGLLVLITKNFIRNKQIVRLDEDTIKLCEVCGFTLTNRHYRKIENPSFWRALYRKRFPDSPQIEHEDILIFLKK